MSSHEIVAPVHQVVFRDTMIYHAETSVFFDKEQKHTGRYIRLLLYLLLVYVIPRNSSVITLLCVTHPYFIIRIKNPCFVCE